MAKGNMDIRKFGKLRKSKSNKRKTKTISKTVKKNTRDINKLKSVGFQYCPFYQTIAETFSGPVHVHLLTQPTNWTQCFRTHAVADADLPRQYHLKSINFSWMCQAETTETGNLWFQMMLVSLKQKTAAQVIERTTRLSNLTDGLDYIHTPAGTTSLTGSWGYKLNPALYTVHYQTQRRIGQVTMDDVQITNINDSTARGSHTVKFPRIFKNDQTDDDGFKGLTFADLEPRQQLYLVTFSNASSTVTGGELFQSFRVDYNGHMNLPD